MTMTRTNSDTRQTRTHSFTYEQYSDSSALPLGVAPLLEEATAALDLAYAPYSGFRVGVALELENGTYVRGANQENAAYPQCLCAERAALAVAHTQFPQYSIRRMAIVVSNAEKLVDQPAAPCGSCRQVIHETEQRQGSSFPIFLRGETGPILRIAAGSDLLPLGFDATFL